MRRFALTILAAVTVAFALNMRARGQEEGPRFLPVEIAAAKDFVRSPLLYFSQLGNVLHDGVESGLIQPAGAWQIYDNFNQALQQQGQGPAQVAYASYLHGLSDAGPEGKAREAHLQAAKRVRLARRNAALNEVLNSDDFTTAPFSGVQ